MWARDGLGLYRGALSGRDAGERRSPEPPRPFLRRTSGEGGEKTHSLPALGGLIGQLWFLLAARPFAARLAVWANQIYGNTIFLSGGMYSFFLIMIIYYFDFSLAGLSTKIVGHGICLHCGLAVQPATWQSILRRAAGVTSEGSPVLALRRLPPARLRSRRQ